MVDVIILVVGGIACVMTCVVIFFECDLTKCVRHLVDQIYIQSQSMSLSDYNYITKVVLLIIATISFMFLHLLSDGEEMAARNWKRFYLGMRAFWNDDLIPAWDSFGGLK